MEFLLHVHFAVLPFRMDPFLNQSSQTPSEEELANMAKRAAKVSHLEGTYFLASLYFR